MEPLYTVKITVLKMWLFYSEDYIQDSKWQMHIFIPDIKAVVKWNKWLKITVENCNCLYTLDYILDIKWQMHIFIPDINVFWKLPNYTFQIAKTLENN